jgi:hypothetical protein
MAAQSLAAPPPAVLGNVPTKCRLGEGVPLPLMLARMPPPISRVPAGQPTVAVAKENGSIGPPTRA